MENQSTGNSLKELSRKLDLDGAPEDVAVRITESYISAFTSLGEVLKQAVGGKGKLRARSWKRRFQNKSKKSWLRKA
jgi:hypothetical protein